MHLGRGEMPQSTCASGFADTSNDRKHLISTLGREIQHQHGMEGRVNRNGKNKSGRERGHMPVSNLDLLSFVPCILFSLFQVILRVRFSSVYK